MKRIAPLLAAFALLGGCRGEQAPTATVAQVQPQAASEVRSAAQTAELNTLIQVTTPLQDFEKAQKAGWSAQITPCMTTPEGGMGFHYGNPTFIDGIARVDQPELLLFEPQATGKPKLVAVEYIVPYTFHARSAAPPVLFGQKFTQVDAFQLWGLHVWIWKANALGLFKPWNPTVSCQFATTSTTMTH